MAENCLSLESWSYRPAFPDTLWITEAFARDNEALTKALQLSISDDSSGSAPLPASETRYVPPEPAVFGSEPDLAAKPARNPIPCSTSGKITKRKSRASKKSPTTYITADPANFRQMVQQVTGVRFGDPTLPVETVLKPEPQRPGVNRAVFQQSCLPTLDTSAFLLDRAGMVGSGYGSGGSMGEGTGSGFEYESFSSFPTLESWRAM